MSTETPSYNAISRPEATGGDLGRQRSQSESPDNLVDGTDHPDGGYEAWVTLFGCFCSFLGLFIPMTYIASYAQAQGMSLHTAYLMVTLMNVGSLLGRWLPGWLGDKLGRFNTQVAALSLCLVSILGIWKSAGDKLAVLTVFVLLFGLGSGSGISLVPVCIAQLCKTEDYGKYFTAIYSVGSFG
ncbi:hypothetical protein SEUCBS140593_009404 [Sporothrix eucalyptigena]|uniref:Major facilitator superfamily (MFS) profile domain-containing protein n=1 Tax=Sporothrix eucalyptigena TaxID=1812306 RepID=A0ABP0CVJ2_9PEZI